MAKLLIIATGGGIGAVLRYLVAGWGQKLTTGVFPIGTMVVNVAGCFLIGTLGALFAGPHLVREEYRWLLMVGVLGGFTTFSTFGLATFELLNTGHWRHAALNVVLSNVLGLAAVWLGYRLGQAGFGQ